MPAGLLGQPCTSR